MKTKKELAQLLEVKKNEPTALKNFYKSTDDYTIFANKDSAGLSIKVNYSAGWHEDVHNEDVFKLMSNGRLRASIQIGEGNIANYAKQMYNLNEKAGGEEQGLKVDDYIKILQMYYKAKSDAQK